MPLEYEKIRDSIAKGPPVGSKKYKAAQSEAAAIYNTRHPDSPVTGKRPEPRFGIKRK
jgi:hypothetical protein